MTDDSQYERDKRARRQLRRQQRSLQRQFVQNIRTLSEPPEWRTLSERFSDALARDALLDPHWIDTERYPLAFYNLFTALGFEVFAGPMPRVSGVQSAYWAPLLAYHPSRAVLLNQLPSTLFADIADIQPLCPVPILGLAYNRIIWSKPGKGFYSEYPARELSESRRIAGALAVGHVALSYDDIRESLLLDPKRNAKRLRQIAARTGILSFLRPPIDALPIFGQHVSANRGDNYDIEQFLSEAVATTASGAELSPGDVTQAKPDEALDEPERYVRELRKAKLLDTGRSGRINATQQGWAYLRARVLPFPLSQLLYHAISAAREEVKSVAQTAFADALRLGTGLRSIDSQSALLSIDEIDSFAAVALIAPAAVTNSVPVTASEEHVKNAICSAIGDSPRKDWGGEQNDIFTMRVTLNGQRVAAAFLLKGPSVRGRLTIAKCGKNGDQIQRLFQSAADLFVIQFNGAIDERVVAEARDKVLLLRARGSSTACCLIMDGIDTARFLAAYA